MLHELADPGDLTPEELHERYLGALVDVLDDRDTSEAVEETGLDRETLERLAGGEPV